MAAEQLLTELAEPACFPHAPRRVEILQTHLSVVCLVDDLVYKLKKAVTLPFVDFAPLSARRQACRDEVRLNRRLCPDVYLGTAALRRVEGRLRFAALDDDDGDDLDVAVVMRRMPQDRMLDELVRDCAATEAEIRQLAVRIAEFHARAECGPEVLAAGDPGKLVGFAADNFAELAAVPKHGLPETLLAALAAASAAGFERLLPELQHRAAAGRVVDGHGDLHARNVCMTTPPSIYDCIEFEPAFRCGDVATEIAFLAMDLRYRGAPALAATFVDEYARHSGDKGLRAVLPLLCSYRAMVRAKVAAMAAAEAEMPESEREGGRRSALEHLLLAAAYVVESVGPRWLVVCGPPASGKSRLCQRLGETVHWPQLATDAVRKQLAGLAATATAGPHHYSPEFSRRTYAELLAIAARRTRAGEPAILLDGNFPTSRHRDEARAAAATAGAHVTVVHVDIDVETAATRAERRSDEADSISDADAAIARKLHERFEAPAANEPSIRLDGSRPTAELVAVLFERLLSAAR